MEKKDDEWNAGFKTRNKIPRSRENDGGGSIPKI